MKQKSTWIGLWRNWPFLFTLAIAATILGPLEGLAPLYPVAFIIGSGVILFQKHLHVNVAYVFLILACAFSIIMADPLPVFQPWTRLAYLILVLVVLSPMIVSHRIALFRIQLYEWIIRLSMVTGVASFFCYFLGINYFKTYYAQVGQVAGTFGGLTMQSMLLGPLSALGVVSITYHIINHQLLYHKQTGWKELLILFTCLSSVLLSASRGALLSSGAAILYMLFEFFRNNPRRFFKAGCFIILAFGAMYPLTGHFSHGVFSKQQANIKAGSMFSSRNQLWDDRKNEFLDSPVYGVGFASQRIVSYNISLRTGVIEPGTSYGAVFAMTGMLGGIPFLYVLLVNLRKRPYVQRMAPVLSPAQPVLAFFTVHMITEGYVFAAGSPLCAIFWSSLGAASAYRTFPCSPPTPFLK